MSEELYPNEDDIPAQPAIESPSLAIMSHQDQETYLACCAQQLEGGNATVNELFGTPQLTRQSGDSSQNTNQSRQQQERQQGDAPNPPAAKSPNQQEEWNGRLDAAGQKYFKDKYGVDTQQIFQSPTRPPQVVVRRSSDGRQLLDKQYKSYQDFVDNFEQDVAKHPLVKPHLDRQQAPPRQLMPPSAPQNPGSAPSQQEAPIRQEQNAPPRSREQRESSPEPAGKPFEKLDRKVQPAKPK